MEKSMRIYMRMPAQSALKVLAEGFWNMHTLQGDNGVYCDDRPGGLMRAGPGTGVLLGGPQGDTTLCLEVPEDLFRERESQESTRPLTADEEKQIESGGPEPATLEYQHMGYAVI